MAGKRTNGSEAGDSHTEDDSRNVVITDDGEILAAADNDGIPLIEPSTISGEPDPEPSSGKRTRGRPRGARNATSKQSKKDTQNLAGLLMSLHMMGATLIKCPELEIEQDEAKRLGEAVSKVNELYGGFVLSEKTEAWIGLAMALGTVYGPRALAYKMRVRNEEQQKKQQPPQTIDGVGVVH